MSQIYIYVYNIYMCIYTWREKERETDFIGQKETWNQACTETCSALMFIKPGW
jgi:hypothetical protein